MSTKKTIFGILLHVVLRHVSYKYECNFDSTKCNWNQKWNNDKCWCDCKNPKEHHVSEKIYILNPATCSCKNGRKYVGSITDNSIVTCDDIIEETKLFQ